MSTDKHSQDEIETVDTGEIATADIIQMNGKPAGAALFLSADQLRDLGIGLMADRVRYEVVDGELRVTPISP